MRNAQASQYKPRAGSIAECAILWLESNGSADSTRLANVCECDTGMLISSLSTAVRYGAVRCEARDDGPLLWSLGDGTPPAHFSPAPPASAPPTPATVSAPAIAAIAPVAPVHAAPIRVPTPPTLRKAEDGPELEAQFLPVGAVRQARFRAGAAASAQQGEPAPPAPPARSEVAAISEITISIRCTPHQAERITKFVNEMRECRETAA